MKVKIGKNKFYKLFFLASIGQSNLEMNSNGYGLVKRTVENWVVPVRNLKFSYQYEWFFIACMVFFGGVGFCFSFMNQMFSDCSTILNAINTFTHTQTSSIIKKIDLMPGLKFSIR